MNHKVIAKLPAPLIKVLNKVFGGSSSSVFKGMATLALGSGMAKLIGIAAIPILTRLYSPEDFGVLAVFSALISILAPILTFRYVLALPLPRHDGLAFNLLILSFGLILINMLITISLLWAFGEPLLMLFSMEVLIPWWWLIALGLFGTAIYEMLTLWATRQRKYRIIAVTNMWQTTLGSVSKIVLGLLAFNPLGLLIGQVVTQGAGSTNLAKSFSKEFKSNWHHLRCSRLRKVAWKYRGFAIYRVPSQFLNSISVQAPLIFSALLFSTEIVGQLGLAFMALALPSNLFAQTTSKAFYAEISKIGKHNPLAIKKITIEVVKKVFILGLLPTLVIVIVGPALFAFSFGEEWRLSGELARFLAIYLVAQYVYISVSNIFTVFGKERKLLFLSFSRFFIVCFVFLISNYLSFDVSNAILLYSCAIAFYFALSTVIAFKELGGKC